jgi:hypothetical protein
VQSWTDSAAILPSSLRVEDCGHLNRRVVVGQRESRGWRSGFGSALRRDESACAEPYWRPAPAAKPLDFRLRLRLPAAHDGKTLSHVCASVRLSCALPVVAARRDRCRQDQYVVPWEAANSAMIRTAAREGTSKSARGCVDAFHDCVYLPPNVPSRTDGTE